LFRLRHFPVYGGLFVLLQFAQQLFVVFFFLAPHVPQALFLLFGALALGREALLGRRVFRLQPLVTALAGTFHFRAHVGADVADGSVSAGSDFFGALLVIVLEFAQGILVAFGQLAAAFAVLIIELGKLLRVGSLVIVDRS